MSLRCFWCQHYLMEKNATNELGEEISTFQKLSPKPFVSKPKKIILKVQKFKQKVLKKYKNLMKKSTKIQNK